MGPEELMNFLKQEQKVNSEKILKFLIKFLYFKHR
jgi:hypothetical protein